MRHELTKIYNKIFQIPDSKFHLVIWGQEKLKNEQSFFTLCVNTITYLEMVFKLF